MKLSHTSTLWVLLSIAYISNAYASGSISKLYVPYVQQLENEFEYEFIIQNDSRPSIDNQQRHKFAYGQSLSDRWFVEFGIAGTKDSNQSFKIDGYEIEAKFQLTEQGEYNNDWGLLFEIEREKDPDIWEFGSTLIVLHEWKRWVGTANAKLIYETGNDIDDEFEAELSTQLKYRHSSKFEPAVEFFKSEKVNAAGPSFSGQVRLGGGKNIFWHSGVVFSFDHSKPDSIFKANIEVEF